MDININELNGLTLAYLGDAVIELMTRERLIMSGSGDVGKFNIAAGKYVRADSQSAAVERLLPVLSEEEAEVYRHGRNAHTKNTPKSATAVDYRRATGMEALFGYLYLLGRKDRLEELFHIAYPEDDETQKN